MTPNTDEELIAAARAVVERWDTPHWKDVPATAVFINRLRDALCDRLEGRGGKERAGLLDAYEAFIKLDFMAAAYPDLTAFCFKAGEACRIALGLPKPPPAGQAKQISEARAVLSREGEGWREIETAKPGPPVMLWIPGFVGAEVCVGVVRDCEAYGVTMLEWVDRDIGEPFETIDGPVYPTHWRPLPAPPSQGGE